MTIRQKKELVKLLISIALVILISVINLLIIPIGDNNYRKLSLYILVYIFISYKIVFIAFKNLFKGQIFDENFLMMIATVGALILGEYIEGLAVILLYQIGEFFQSYAVNKSRKSITNLIDLSPERALVITDNNIVIKELDEVNIGDILLVKPGEKIAVDGIIIDGESALDEKALTGETKYKDVGKGDYVLSGMINVNGTLKIEAQKKYCDSTASKIIELIELSGVNKSKSEKFITKFARVYTPIVVVMAVILAIVPSLFFGNWNTWIYRSLNFLVVSCPCALVISIPLSFFSGIGKASKLGILIKGSTFIEKINKTKTFVFDKTGTITKGNFIVSDIKSIYEKKEVLRCAYIAESNSNHPIAKSIKDCYISRYGENEEYLQYKITEVAGKGIIAEKNEEVILCGNEKLLSSYNIKVPNENFIGSVCYIAKNNMYLGSIIINDEIKGSSYPLFAFLNTNYQTIILSGDNKEIVKEVQNELKIKKAYSSLLPEQKISKLDEISKSDPNVCYIGDGINDAPCLVKAEIGISMGLKGSDVAIEASDIVIMDDDILSIKKLKLLARKIMNIVYQNIIFSLFIKFLVLILSAFGYTNMWLAIFADVGVAIIAILNAMRVSLY